MHMLARLERLLARHRWIAPALLAVLAGVLLFARLGIPDEIIFDETYYVEDALGYLDTLVEPSFAVHPPVGKWAIAGSIALLGETPFGWRAASALAGLLTVLLTHAIGLRLLVGRPLRRVLAFVAGLLVTTDGLFLAQQRIAMLDPFLVVLTAAGFWLLLVDRDRRRAGRVRRGRPSVRWVAGVVFGLAIGVKWSGLLGLGVAGLLTIGWEVGEARATARRRNAEAVSTAAAVRAGVGERTDGPLATRRVRVTPTGDETGWWRQLPRRAVAVLGSLVVVPLVVYAATWVPWAVGFEASHEADCEDPAAPSCSFTPAERALGVLRHHDAMATFHRNLEADHGYRSDPLGWVVLARPVVYSWDTCSEERASGVPTEDEDGELVAPEPCVVAVDEAREILALGNPVLWWGFLPLLPTLVAGAVRRDRRSALPLVGWLGQWLPWLVVSRAAFLFYLAPSVPLLALGVVVGLDRLGARVGTARAWVGTVVGGALGAATALPVQWVLGAEGWRPAVIGAVLGGLVGAALASLREPTPRPPRDDVPGEPPTTPLDGGTAATDTTSEERGGADAAEPELVRIRTTPVPSASSVLAPSRAVTARREDDRRASRVTGRLLTLVVLLQSASFAWFAPVWLAIPMAEEAIRQRWWFSGWI